MSKINLNRTCASPLSMTVVLVGLMGVGKTSIGKRLAERLKMPFSDADEEIEKASGLSIPDFFEKFGDSIHPSHSALSCHVHSVQTFASLCAEFQTFSILDMNY